ncbi:hypothetical protein DYB26_007246 [Aphanomyces astaci]|uniref:FHA domain-containing protein n=1 Tax=Aphanomyces astaci TaxID=112090 RepID=A0A397AGG6_APHAT|nr:hypothetical protein DYB36_003188 [Aphanomyces astaci]RHY53754.1 hypothetical protein DYB34_002982 [Aphanomyces astaci]RHY79677.1 hypothetical protein DYB31_009317 [Aphanomyces astaci]RHZ06291.1 hypothetical protein DYB26_007246 [Aphanomyces astaci]
MLRAAHKTLHWPVAVRVVAARVHQARLASSNIKSRIQGCINDLAKVKVALNCDHVTNNSFHSLGTAAYSCVRCGVRIDSSSKAYFFVQALDVAMFEYPLLTLRPKLLQLLSRLEIGLEDLQSFCRQHRVEVETTAALLIQRMALLHIRRKCDRNAASQHSTAKKRRQDESAFLVRMRSQALPALRQHVIVPPPVPLPTPNCRLPQLNNPKSASMLMQLVRLDASCASDAQVIRIHNDDVSTNGMVLGRSAKHCDVIVDCPKYPGLVSKQHLRVIVVDNTAVMVEDLGSKNGTYVNGNKQHQRTELHVGDTIELGRVKHRTESGVVLVCHHPNRTTSML